jgi:tetratricopeptide (TPR) repeat protein
MMNQLQQALQHHRKGELVEAESLYRSILQAEPRHPDANHNLGVIAVAVGKPDLAIPFFKLALESNPNQVQFWLSYIDALIKTEQFDLARAVLTQGKEYYGLQGDLVDSLSNALSSLNIADACAEAVELRECGRFLEAIDWLKKYLVKNPNNVNAYAHLAHVLSLNKQDTEAWTALNFALSIDPHSILVQRNHARLLLKQQKTSEARQIAETIYQIDSINAENQVVFASTVAVNNELELAKKLCENALQQNSNYAEAFAILGQVYLKIGDKNNALEKFEKALSIKPHLTQLYSIVMMLHNENGNIKAVIATLQKALEHEPNEIGHMVNLGEFLRQNNQVLEAIALLEKAVILAPNNVMALTNLGTALQQIDEIEKAKIAYQKALEIDPKQYEPLSNLGLLAHNERNWRDALNYFEMLLNIRPLQIPIMINMIFSLNNLGDYERSEKIARVILEIDSRHENAHYMLGTILQNQYRLREANTEYMNALKINPDCKKSATTLAINSYLLLDYSVAIDCINRASLVFNESKDKKLETVKIYTLYVTRLLNWWQLEIKKTGLIFNEKNHNLPILAVIGESHSLAAHRTNIKIGQNIYRCQSYWIYGIKMWHLAQPEAHPIEHQITTIINMLPSETPVMFTIGEIDCRFDEGIWVTAKKQSTDCRVLIEKTVGGYLDWLEVIVGQRNIIIQGVPAPNYPLDEEENSSEDIADFLKMIALINQRLMFHSLAKGWQFLDIYGATVSENGRSNQQWHIDGNHLQPNFYAQAERWIVQNN